MMLCLENLLKSNTCITAVEFSREDLDIWEQIAQINKKKKKQKHLFVLKGQFTLIGFLTAKAQQQQKTLCLTSERSSS